jgi:CRP-like cAMP-binding protein
MIVCKGSVTLAFSNLHGRPAMLGLSERGEVLGISSAVSGHPHEVSADAVGEVRVAAISLTDFRRLQNRFPSIATAASEELSRKVNRAYDTIRLVGSGLSVPQRLAGWLLRMQDRHPDQPGRVTIALTHERISQLLGASRESVTRALSQFKRHGAVEVRGIHVYLLDHRYLKSLSYSSEPFTAKRPT